MMRNTSAGILHLLLSRLLFGTVITFGGMTASGAQQDLDPMFETFQNPPVDASPSGNLAASANAAAVRAQLDRAKQLGLHELHMGVEVSGAGAPPYQSEEWKAVMQATIEAAGAAGMEVTVNTSPGFSHTGDPTVRPEQAMKKLVWSMTAVPGGHTGSISLPAPPDNSGPYQNFPSDNSSAFTSTKDVHFYRDTAVIAYRTPHAAASNT